MKYSAIRHTTNFTGWIITNEQQDYLAALRESDYNEPEDCEAMANKIVDALNALAD